MASILGYISLLLGQKTGRINDSQREFLNHVKVATDRLHRLVNKLLSISQIEAGQAALDIEDVDLAALLTEEAALFKAEADAKQIALSLDLAPNLGKAHCDPDKIREVMSNLLSNALKYTPQNGHIRVSAVDAGQRFEIVVEDNGIGVKPADQNKIFEPFHRLNKSGLKGEESTGLGLALVIKIVEAHQGKVLLKSQEGKGSAFTVILPKVRS
jgi:signal transduction histidine kinase